MSNNGYAVIYDSWDYSNGEWKDDMYEVFDTPEDAEKMFLSMVGDDPGNYSNPRIVKILRKIAAPNGMTWGERE